MPGSTRKRRYELTDAAWERLFDRILQRLHLQLDEQGRIDWSQFDIDGSHTRAERSAAGGSKKAGASASRSTTRSDAAEGAGAASFIW